MSEPDPKDYDPRAVNKAIRERMGLTDDDRDTRFFGPAAPPEAREKDPRWYTADGVFLSDGLLVIDYDMKPKVFTWAEQDARAHIDTDWWDGWFSVGGSLMNGERMTTRDPFTRAKVTQADVDRGSMRRP